MKLIINIICFLFLSTITNAFENRKINLGIFSINKYEITIKEFSEYAKKKSVITLAEKNGGGYEWGAGWEKRTGWNYKTPFGKKPSSILEPAVHLNRFEAEEYCKYKSGRLPTFKEWKLAAYTQLLNSNKYTKGKTYIYPSGDKPEGLNSQGVLNFDKHVDVTSLPEGINGLVAMGGNVWEWINDQNEKQSLTAGASWWYGANKTRASGAQYKPSNFYVIYVGFRCAFNNEK
jgi:sulfatase modifying factor 1